LRTAVSLAKGLRVFPTRMRENLDADGGRIMAEAYMITLASKVGRDRAHEIVYQAVRESRTTGRPLLSTLQDSVTPEIWAEVGPIMPTAEDYLGSVPQVCAAAVAEWRGGPSESSDPDAMASEKELELR
jgi:3-carboxy-cis,cis-muconate cycloisomerase